MSGENKYSLKSRPIPNGTSLFFLTQVKKDKQGQTDYSSTGRSVQVYQMSSTHRNLVISNP